MAESDDSVTQLEQKMNEKREKRKRIRDQVVREILSTERSYVESLQSLVALYVRPIRDAVKTKDRILKDEHIAKLFSNIEMVVNIHVPFLVDLERVVSEWSDESSISPLFTKYAPFFKVYTVYVNNHENASALLHKLLKEKKYSKFQKFESEATANPLAKGLNLNSFLIMPIQRIPRYKLLLSEIIKNTEESHVDHVGLGKALEVINGVAMHVNDAVRISENHRYLLQIQDEFTNPVDLIAPNRVFVRKGSMLRVCRKEHREYMFYLFNDLLIYGTKRGWKYKIHKLIPIGKGFLIKDVEDTAEIQHRWQVINTVKSFAMIAPSVAEKESWMSDMQACIDDQMRTIHAAVAGDGSVAPVWVQDKDQLCCVACSKKFTMIRRRHHCRWVDREGCGRGAWMGHMRPGGCSGVRERRKKMDDVNVFYNYLHSHFT